MIYSVKSRETISSLVAATGFTSTHLTAFVDYAVVQAIAGNVRYCIDGTTPVAATTGLRLIEDDVIEVWGGKAISNFKAIDDGGTAKLEVVYMGHGG